MHAVHGCCRESSINKTWIIHDFNDEPVCLVNRWDCHILGGCSRAAAYCSVIQRWQGWMCFTFSAAKNLIWFQVLLVVYLICNIVHNMLYLCFHSSFQTILQICYFLYLAFFNLLFWEIVSSSRVAKSLERSRKCFPWIILNLLFASEIRSWMNYMVDIFGNNWLLNSSSRFNLSEFSDLHFKFYCEPVLKRILSVC